VAVCPVVHQVDGWQQVWIIQLACIVKKELPLFGVDCALNLTAIVIQLIECDLGLNIRVEVLHVKHRSVVSTFC